MRMRCPPRAFFVFVGLTILQPVLFVLVGALHQLNTRGTGVLVVLLVALAYRSRIAWTLLVVLNALPLLALVGVTGGQVLWSHVVVMVLTGVCLETALLSQPMRQYVHRTPARTDIPMPSG